MIGFIGQLYFKEMYEASLQKHLFLGMKGHALVKILCIVFSLYFYSAKCHAQSSMWVLRKTYVHDVECWLQESSNPSTFWNSNWIAMMSN